MEKTLDKNKMKELEKKKLSFLEDNNIDELKLSYNMAKTIRELGFKIIECDFPDKIDGLILVDSKGELTENGVECKIIGVNKNLDPYKKRFTVAHEFAHYILQDNKDVVAFRDHSDKHNNNNVNKELEDDVDYIASSIIMPINDFKKELEFTNKIYGSASSDKYEKLQKNYGADIKAIVYREKEVEILLNGKSI